MNHTLSVIIRSAGQRKAQILDAVASAFCQKNIDVTVIVILNGANIDPDLPDILGDMNDVTVEYRKDFNLPDATLKGRQMVRSDYFCYLDDDDIFLEDQLYKPCAILAENRGLDVVACNGFLEDGESRHKMFEHPISLENNPLEKLFDQNWLASCGGIFRRSTVGEAYFSVRLKYFEWTMTAFLLALDRNITYWHEPIFMVNDTAGSVSASTEYLEAGPTFLRSLSTYTIPKNIKKIISQRYVASLHNVSSVCLQQKKYRKAWTYHIRSLCHFRGLKYLPYTRHLIG